jgi:hypothetical protein
MLYKNEWKVNARDTRVKSGARVHTIGFLFDHVV